MREGGGMTAGGQHDLEGLGRPAGEVQVGEADHQVTVGGGQVVSPLVAIEVGQARVPPSAVGLHDEPPPREVGVDPVRGRLPPRRRGLSLHLDEVRERDESLQFGDLTVLMGAPSRELLASTVLDLVETAPGELNFVFSRIDPADGEHQGDGEAGQCTPGVCGSGCGCGS